MYAPSTPSNGPWRLRDLSENPGGYGSSLYTASLAYFWYAARRTELGVSIPAAMLLVQPLILDSKVQSAGSWGIGKGSAMTAMRYGYSRMMNEVA